MASPQRQFQTEPEPEFTPPSRPQLQPAASMPGSRRASKGWRFGYSWILICALLLIWYVGFGWGNSGGWIWGHRDSTITPFDEGRLSGPGVAILEVADKQDYAGQTFEVRNVPVDHWSGSNAVWIGSSHSYLPMLLILPPGAGTAGASPAPVKSNQSPNVASGATAPLQRLNVTGKVVKAPPLAQAQRQWNLTDEDADQLEEEGVYIQATGVQLVKR